MISIKTPAMQWVASACSHSVRLADGPAKLHREKSARSQAAAFYARPHAGVVASGAPVYNARIELPANQLTKGGLCGPQPWRDKPVIT
ncbi:hypothetical protein [Nonomuraea sp. NPDC002799]